ncbi:MAG: DUF5615 family PIN-like protein [Acidobacteria bacterium]|nr:DUF5615 family PIN-like protein [Acidobacteriota bacterium]
MKLLLDECVTSYLRSEFVGHDVSTVDEAGLKGLKNGKLLAAAAENFDVLITVDQNLRYQQNLTDLKIGVLVLRSRRSTFAALKPLMPDALERLKIIERGDVVTIGTKVE